VQVEVLERAVLIILIKLLRPCGSLGARLDVTRLLRRDILSVDSPADAVHHYQSECTQLSARQAAAAM